MVLDEHVFVRQLRIGNLVQDLQRVPKQVCLISLDIDDEYLPLIEMVDIGKSSHATGDIIRNILPIPLTIEWVKKLGFHPINGPLSPAYSIRDFTITFPFDHDRVVYQFENYQVDITDIEIKFVHQLQNLYFCITGEELQVK